MTSFERSEPVSNNPWRRLALTGAKVTAALMTLLVMVDFQHPALAASPLGEKRVFDSMHARVEIIIPHESGSALPPGELADQAEAVIRKADFLFNPFGADSDLYRLNSAGAGRWVKVDPLTMTLTREALKWHQLSGGLFDPTIGPLKRLYKFDKNVLNRWPSERETARAIKKVGADKLKLDIPGNRLAWAEDGMALDLSAVAKGFAADLAAELMSARGVKNALINVGGEMRVMGINPGPPAAPWRVGLTDPRGESTGYLAEIKDRGLASSGNYESYFEYDGRRYSHIINPKTGRPLEDIVAGVTVAHPTHATAADALATIMCLLGPEEGEAFLRRRAESDFSGGLEVVMFTKGEQGEMTTVLMTVDRGGTVIMSSRPAR